MADINNINVNSTTYNIVDDEAMRFVSNPTNNNILVTNANGQAVDSGVDVNDTMLLVSNPTNNNVLITNSNGQAVDSGVSISDIGGSGLTIDLLWTNASPTTAMASQDISLDLSNYSMGYLVSRVNSDDPTQTGALLLKNVHTIVYGTNYQLLAMLRVDTYFTDTVLHIGTPYRQGSVNNNCTIPIYFYGIR